MAYTKRFLGWQTDPPKKNKNNKNKSIINQKHIKDWKNTKGSGTWKSNTPPGKGDGLSRAKRL
jgi:hypothetical protein